MHKRLKIEYPFNTAANLEVEFQPGRWARVTPNWFRSFVGVRRIDGQPYTGPVFYEGTNTLYHPSEQECHRIVGIEELNSVKPKRNATRQVKLLYPNKRQRRDLNQTPS